MLDQWLPKCMESEGGDGGNGGVGVGLGDQQLPFLFLLYLDSSVKVAKFKTQKLILNIMIR